MPRCSGGAGRETQPRVGLQLACLDPRVDHSCDLRDLCIVIEYGGVEVTAPIRKQRQPGIAQSRVVLGMIRLERQRLLQRERPVSRHHRGIVLRLPRRVCDAVAPTEPLRDFVRNREVERGSHLVRREVRYAGRHDRAPDRRQMIPQRLQLILQHVATSRTPTSLPSDSDEKAITDADVVAPVEPSQQATMAGILRTHRQGQ